MVGGERDEVSLENFPGGATSYRAQIEGKGRISKKGKRKRRRSLEKESKKRERESKRPLQKTQK